MFEFRFSCLHGKGFAHCISTTLPFSQGKTRSQSLREQPGEESFRKAIFYFYFLITPEKASLRRLLALLGTGPVLRIYKDTLAW